MGSLPPTPTLQRGESDRFISIGAGFEARIKLVPVRVSELSPTFYADDREGEFEGGRPGIGVGSFEDFVDFLFGGGLSRIFRVFVPSQEAEIQAAFLAVIDMAVENEGIDGVEIANLLVGVGVGGGLEDLAFLGVRRMEPLFGENDAAWLVVKHYFGTANKIGELLDILEGDARGVVRMGGGFIVPGAAIEKIFGIGMKGDVPIEITALSGTGLFCEIFNEGTSGESLLSIAAGVVDIPVVFE